MGSSQEDITDDEFDVEEASRDYTVVLQRLKEFSFYLVENIEFNLDFCLKLLEERTVPAKPNSMHVTALSMLCSAIPKIGGGLGSALKTGEVTLFRKIEKKNSRLLADLVYYFSDNKQAFRDTVLEAAVEIFASFENKFMEFTCNGGEKRAMMKLAIDASDRIFNYFLSTEQKRDVTKNEFIRGVLYGDSKRNRGGKKEGKSVTKNDNAEQEIKIKTDKLYSKSGIYIPVRNLFYKNDHTKPEKYGYRKLFSWEDETEIMQTWTLDDTLEKPVYTINVTDELLLSIKEYVMSKNRFEEAILARQKLSDEAKEDRQQKHEAALTMLKECYDKIISELENIQQKTLDMFKESTTLMEKVVENQEADKETKTVIITKLESAHSDILDTKGKQEDILKSNEDIKNNIVAIRTNQEELATSTLKHEDVESIVNVKVKEGAKDGVKEFISETLRKNDPGPTIKREVERSLGKTKNELKRFEQRIRKFKW
ncbi:uncharacterized protein [Diabrotica undecimpunctata]|uniref:uncharacterized protein isoform X1 n=2 Tax=Diabrotica undecimpunctata TaxID=50387 RepID=UPI003B638253